MKANYITATNIIIGLCILVFYISRSTIGQYVPGFELYYFQNPNFHFLQLLSHMFMHGSINHLLLNMLGLWMFGSALESIWKTKKFLIYYFLCGLGAAVIFLLVNYIQFEQVINSIITSSGYKRDYILSIFNQGKYFPSYSESEHAIKIYSIPVVGASGALYGLLVGFAWYFPNHKIMLIFLPIPIAAKYFVPVLLALDLLSGITGFSIFGQNVAHFAHIGGAVTGALLLSTLFKRPQQQAQQSIGVWRND